MSAPKSTASIHGQTSRLVAVLVRVFAKVEQVGECYEWLGCYSGTRQPRPQMHYEGRTQYVTRVLMTELAKVSSLRCVLHTCDNERCVNPEHLVVGTHQENMTQCKERGRTKRVGHVYGQRVERKRQETNAQLHRLDNYNPRSEK